MGSVAVRVYPLAFFFASHWWEVDLRVWPVAGTRWSEAQLRTEPVVRRVFTTELSDDGELYAGDLERDAVLELLEHHGAEFVNAYSKALRSVPDSPIAGPDEVVIAEPAYEKPEGNVVERTVFETRWVAPSSGRGLDGSVLVRRELKR